MHTRLKQLPDRSFSFGSVSMPGFPLPELRQPEPQIPIRTTAPAEPAEDPEPPTLRGSLLSVILGTKPENSELQKQRARLLNEVDSIGSRLDEFIEACDTERATRLADEHATVRAAGRKQAGVVAKATSEFNNSNAEWNRTHEAKARAHDALQGAHHQLNRLSQWASDAEITEATNVVIRAEDKVRAAIQAETEALRERNGREDAMFAAKEELARLSQEEIRIRNEISGKAYIDSELGLEVPASA